jgi:hypothetical protein
MAGLYHIVEKGRNASVIMELLFLELVPVGALM